MQKNSHLTWFQIPYFDNPRTFFFLRHGETDWNYPEKRLQGQTDIPLNPMGHRQAEEIANMLRPPPFHRIISSDLQRAQQTAFYLHQKNPQLNSPILDHRLREIHLGDGEGLTWDDLEDSYAPGFRDLWSKNTAEAYDLRFKTGESRREVLTRVLASVGDFLNNYPNETLVFVSHGFVIRSLVYLTSQIETPFFVPNCALVPFQWNQQNLVYTGSDSTTGLTQPVQNHNPYKF